MSSDLILPSRRSFLTELGAALITAPAIVRVASIMPVKAPKIGTVIRIRLPNDYVVNNGPLLMLGVQHMYSYNATEAVNFASLMLRTPWVISTKLEEM